MTWKDLETSKCVPGACRDRNLLCIKNHREHAVAGIVEEDHLDDDKETASIFMDDAAISITLEILNLNLNPLRCHMMVHEMVREACSVGMIRYTTCRSQ